MSEAEYGIRVDISRCTGCGRCVAACGKRLISLDPNRFRKYAVVRGKELCNLCKCCLESCPFGAIYLDLNLD